MMNEGQEPNKGMQSEVDWISIYTDRKEEQYFTIHRMNHDTEEDTAALYITFSNGDSNGEKFPLHTSEVVVEDFDIEIPDNPQMGGDRDIQPYVSIYLRLRKRYPFGEIVNEDEIDRYKTVRASYRTTIALRNANAASYKKTQITQ